MIKSIIKFVLELFSSKTSKPVFTNPEKEDFLLKDEEPVIKEENVTADKVTEEVSKEKPVVEETPQVEEKVPQVEEKKTFKFKKHYLPKISYFPGPGEKNWLFLHHTAGWENPYNVIDGWGRDTKNTIGTEFLIGGQKVTDGNTYYDGMVVQAFPSGSYAWHLGVGRNALHTDSIGVELNNFGYITRGGYYKKGNWVKKQPGVFYTYVGTKVNPNQVIELEQKFRGYKYWHKYSQKQIESLKELILYIKERDGIDPTKGLVELIKEKGAFEAFNFVDVKYVTEHPGLWLHTNVRKDKFDLYPDPDLIKMLLSL
jgi:hypothetical protein